MLCNPDITEAVDKAKPSKKETTSSEGKFSTIHLLQALDLVIYRNINKEMQNGSYVGRDKYPTTSGGAY